MNLTSRLVSGALAALTALVPFLSAQTRPAGPAPAVGTNPNQDETVVLSPFEVISDNKGYFSPNTMSGTRFNTKLEDLASSMTVITKEPRLPPAPAPC